MRGTDRPARLAEPRIASYSEVDDDRNCTQFATGHGSAYAHLSMSGRGGCSRSPIAAVSVRRRRIR
jgi:hypothetical protein